MTPEEKSRILAETEKLQAETDSLRKGGWGKPSSWIPMIAAIAAILTSIGQCQLSSIKDREASLNAREKVIQAREEEGRLVERNAKLEGRAQELTQEIGASTAEINQLKEEIAKANEQLLALAREKDQDGTLVAKVEKDITARSEKVAAIAASAQSRNIDAQIRNLVWRMNSDVKATRLAAVEELIENHSSNPTAISSAVELISMPQLESLSSSGRINVLVFLRNTEPTAWSADLKARGAAVVKMIRQRAAQGKAYIGHQTEDALNKLERMLEKI